MMGGRLLVVSKEIELNQHPVFTKLTAALAVSVGKFAVGDGGSGNLHGELLCFRGERYGDFSGKRPSENRVLVFQTAFQRFKTYD